MLFGFGRRRRAKVADPIETGSGEPVLQLVIALPSKFIFGIGYGDSYEICVSVGVRNRTAQQIFDVQIAMVGFNVTNKCSAEDLLA